MNYQKNFFALIIAAFFIIACGDASNSANSSGPSCTVTTNGNVVTMTKDVVYEKYITEYTYSEYDTKEIQTNHYISKDAAEQECDYYKSNKYSYENVTCEGTVVKYTQVHHRYYSSVEDIVKKAEEECLEDENDF